MLRALEIGKIYKAKMPITLFYSNKSIFEPGKLFPTNTLVTVLEMREKTLWIDYVVLTDNTKYIFKVAQDSFIIKLNEHWTEVC